MSYIEQIAEAMKAIRYDDKQMESFKGVPPEKCLLRLPKLIEKSKSAMCFEASLYMSDRAYRLGLANRVILLSLDTGKKIIYHSIVVIKENDTWYYIDWPSDIRIVEQDKDLNTLLNKILDQQYEIGRENYEGKEFKRISVQEIYPIYKGKSHISIETFFRTPYKEYVSTKNKRHIEFSPIDRLLDMVQDIEYDWDEINRIAKAKTIELRKQVKLRTISEVVKDKLGICFDTRIYVAYLAKHVFKIDYQLIFIENFDPVHRKFKSHLYSLLNEDGYWYLIAHDSYAAIGRRWFVMRPDLRTKNIHNWDSILKQSIYDNVDKMHTLYIRHLTKDETDALINMKSMCFGDMLAITGSRKDLVSRDKRISKIITDLYDIKEIRYSDGSSVRP